MRWLINYIRSCFCKHDWECLSENISVWGSDVHHPDYHKWVYRCKKCGCRNVIKS